MNNVNLSETGDPVAEWEVTSSKQVARLGQRHLRGSLMRSGIGQKVLMELRSLGVTVQDTKLVFTPSLSLLLRHHSVGNDQPNLPVVTEKYKLFQILATRIQNTVCNYAFRYAVLDLTPLDNAARVYYTTGQHVISTTFLPPLHNLRIARIIDDFREAMRVGFSIEAPRTREEVLEGEWSGFELCLEANQNSSIRLNISLFANKCERLEMLIHHYYTDMQALTLEPGLGAQSNSFWVEYVGCVAELLTIP